ncbi:MAG: alpha-1,3-galactosidase B, partial [Rikenellaceae bacterium]
MKNIALLITFIILFFSPQANAKGKEVTIVASQFGIIPDTKKNISPLVAQMIDSVKKISDGEKHIKIIFSKGRYDFHEEGSFVRQYYISNHDQTNPKKVGLAMEGLENVIIVGGEALFVFHGTMLPISLVNTKNCSLQSLSIDFENPHIAQIKILKNDPKNGITFEVAPWVDYRISDNGF